MACDPSAIAVSALLTLDDVLAARDTIAGRVHRTPTFTSRTLGPRTYLKAELFQRTGSFKPRGVLNKLAQLTAEERARGVISISAGNHAQALAYGAAAEGIDALIVMWRDASAMKVAAARAYGATVDTESTDIPAAFQRLAALQEETGRTLVHPYDDPYVIAGQGTVGLEILEDVPDAGVVLVPVGGGGLVSGISTAVKGLKPDARVVAVEPRLSPTMHEALAAGRSVTVEVASITDGLNAPHAGENCVAICSALGIESILVEEDEIRDAFRFLYGRAKLACETAGAATTAALLAEKVPLDGGETVVAVVSGGNIAAQEAAAILAGR